MLKVGIIGAGRMGNRHAGNLATIQDVQLTAVYDIASEQSRAFAEKYPTARIMDSCQELVDSPDTELIIITSPTYCHAEALQAALATGKAIFCEKPLCRTRKELDALLPLLRNYPGFFTVGFVRRYTPEVIMMKKLISSGKIGRILCASVCCIYGAFRREWGDWFADYEKSGGVMLDMMAHHCDLQNHIVGRPVSIYAQAFRLPKEAPKPYDVVSATAVFEGGVISNMQCSWLRSGPSDTYMTVQGDQGSLKLSDSEGLLFYDLEGNISKVEPDAETLAAMQDTLSSNKFLTEMRAIAACLRDGRKPPVGPEDAINAMTFCLGMMESAETGKVYTF